MKEIIRDAWPWVLTAFILGVLLGVLVSWLSCRGKKSGTVAPVSKPALPTPRVAPKPATALDFVAASTIVGIKVKMDDLTVVEGIGPKIATLLKADGIRTWAQLADATPARLQKVLDAGGSHFNVHDPKTWPKQAGLLAAGKWAEFKTLTDKLVGGR